MKGYWADQAGAGGDWYHRVCLIHFWWEGQETVLVLLGTLQISEALKWT